MDLRFAHLAIQRIALFMITFLLLLCSSPLSSANLLPSTPRSETTSSSTSKSILSEQNEVDSIQKMTEHWQKEQRQLTEKINYYENILDDYASLTLSLKKSIASAINTPSPTAEKNISTEQLEQKISQASSKSLDLLRQIQLEQENMREIIESVNLIPQKLTQARKLLQQAEQYLYHNAGKADSRITTLITNQYSAEVNAHNALLKKLEFEQLSASQRQEISRLRLELLQKQYEQHEQQLITLRNQFNQQRQDDAQKTLDSALSMEQANQNYPEEIQILIQTNANLSRDLNKQTQRLNDISTEQQQAISNTIKVHQALNTLKEQAKWLSMSTGLGDALRLQLSRLPGKPEPQQLDREMANIRLTRINYENLRYELDSLQTLYNKNKPSNLSNKEVKLLQEQINKQRTLLNGLLSNCDNLLIELTNLKIANSQLSDALNEVNNASHRYFFWVADVDPLNFHYPMAVTVAISQLISLNSLSELIGAFSIILNMPYSMAYFIFALLLVCVSLILRKRFHTLLDNNANYVGKVTYDSFMVTLRTIFWSIMMAIPIPLLWASIGDGLQNAWDYPVAVAIGKGVNAASPLLWIFMISASFSHPKGLFIAHFNWPKEDVSRAMRYYQFSIWVLTPLIMITISLNSFNNHQFASTLGRLSFILLCIALFITTLSLKRAHIPLYLDRHGSGDNLINRILWSTLLCAPCFAALAACTGYLRTSQELLGRLEASVAVLFLLLLVYHVIRRWMLIQRRKIAFERAKQRRAERLAQRAKNEQETAAPNSNENGFDIEEPIVDLDTISAQSLWLVRSILTLAGLVILILIWSELHFAFAFLENIKLWSTESVHSGIRVTEQITLASVFIAILIILITIQLVHNLPALLELTILQHVELAPGTGYAISTITKYVILCIGCISGFTIIGIDWGTLQWLIAALGVGLGFGLQEIFANFISGLIILFEKPIRINDTVTIRDLTGTVLKIKTRATTIIDWDRKEIIVPNKAFITEQFINWSLSDAITRVVLSIPATIEADSEQIIAILKKAAANCSYVLDNPQPDVFLVDIQEGIQIFELRVFASDVGQRMPLRNEIHQLILKGYKEHNLELPFPPFQARIDRITHNNGRRAFSSGSL